MSKKLYEEHGTLAMRKVTGEITPEEETRLAEIRKVLDDASAAEYEPYFNRLEGVVLAAEQTAGRMEELRKLLADVEALRVQTEERTIAAVVAHLRASPIATSWAAGTRVNGRSVAIDCVANAIERGDWRPK